MVFVILRFGKLLTEFSMIMFEGVTTIPKGSTLEANASGSGEPLLTKEGEDIV